MSHPGAAWIFLLCGLCVTGFAWRASMSAQEQISLDQFVFRTDEMRAAIQRRMSEHENVLRGATGLFAASEHVTRREWHAYVQSLALDLRDRGILGLGFALRIAENERAATVAAVRADGFSDFAVWPAGVRDEYHIILYLEPFSGRNLRSFGYDMFSEPTRRGALQRARDTGKAAVTQGVRLVEEPGLDEQRGLLMFLPVYRNGAAHESIAERRAALLGHIYSPFRVADLMRGILGNEAKEKEILYSISDGPEQDASTLSGTDRARDGNAKGTRQRTLPLEIAGSHWLLNCRERTAGVLASASRYEPWYIAGAGLLIDALLFIVILSMGRIQSRAVAIAETMTGELRESRERFRFVLDRALDAFVAIDTESRVRAWNSAAEATFGWSKQEILGQPLAQFVIPEAQRGMFLSGFRQLVATGESSLLNKRVELVALHKDGRHLPIEASITARRFGDSYQFSAFLQDISERKRVQEEMRRAKEAAEFGTRAKSDFLAQMSHEIRTPLNGVLGMTELLLRTKLTVEQRDYLETAHASGRGLLQIINDILDFSRIEAGKLELDAVGFSLRHCLGVSLRGLGARVHAKGLELLVSISDEVPDALVGDAQRLGQIIINLAGNAIKFTERGEVIVGVQVAGADRDWVELEFRITDTGVGIPASKHAVIFEAFSQASAATHSQFGGTGLGLAICSRLVKLMHGKIAVESELGRGSVFSFMARFARGAEMTAYAPDLTQVRHRSVLVAVANATGRRLLVEQMTAWGMRATPAADRETTLLLLRKDVRYDLVLLDEQLTANSAQEMREFMSQLRSAAPGCQILLLASAAPAAETWIAPEDLALPRIQRPVLPPALLEHVQALLGARKPLRRAAVSFQPEAGHKPCRVLVAEDNAVNRKVARALLERAGHSVVCVENGLQALSAVESERFDIVFMDVQMPEMDGLEATRRIRARERQGGARLPIVALTAQAIKGDQDRCLEAGMDAYVSKPIELAELYKAIRQLVREPEEEAGREPAV